jgi:integrase
MKSGRYWRASMTGAARDQAATSATVLRLILVTAARPGMVWGMVGSELRDLRGPSEHGPHWSLPAERMKAKSAFVTPLSGLALDLIRPHLKADPAAPLFDLPATTYTEQRQRIVARLGMKRWTPHDLRRTAATILDPVGLFAGADRRAARPHAQGCDGGLRPMGQVSTSGARMALGD